MWIFDILVMNTKHGPIEQSFEKLMIIQWENFHFFGGKLTILEFSFK